MNESASGPATSPVGPQGRCEWCGTTGHYAHLCPTLAERDPVHRGLFLYDLLSELAQLRQAASVVYADAYLEADGNAEARTQAAKKAVADDHLAAELAAARVSAYQVMIGRDQR